MVRAAALLGLLCCALVPAALAQGAGPGPIPPQTRVVPPLTMDTTGAIVLPPWAQVDTTNAANISSGILARARLGPLSGAGTVLVTTDGSFVNGHCPSINAGNLIDSGAPCGSGSGGSGSVTPGTANQLAYYPSSASSVAGLGLSGLQITSNALGPVYGTGAGTSAQGNDGRFPAAVTGLRKGNGTVGGGGDVPAVPNTDYLTPNAPVLQTGPAVSDASNAVATTGITQARLSRVATLAALKSWTNYAFPAERDGYFAPGDGVIVIYDHASTPCAISGGDNGSQVVAADGNCWLARLPSEPNSSIWGATGHLGNTVDAAPYLSNMLAGLQSANRQVGRLASGIHRVLTPVTAPGGYHFTLKGDRWFQAGVTGPGSWISESSALSTTSGSNQPVFNVVGNGMDIEDIGFTQDEPAPSTTANTSYIPTVYPGLFQLGSLTQGDAIDSHFKNVYCFSCYMLIDGVSVSRLNVDGLFGECLFRCVRVGYAVDTPRITNVHDWPFWLLFGNFTQAQIDNGYTYQQANAGAIELQRADNSDVINSFCFACQFVVKMSQNSNGQASRAHLVNVDGDGTKFTIWVTGAGAQFQATNVTATPSGVTSTSTAPIRNGSGIEIDAANVLGDIPSIRCANLGQSCIRINGTTNTDMHVGIGRVENWGNDGIPNGGSTPPAAWAAGPGSHIDIANAHYEVAQGVVANLGPQVSGDVQQPRFEMSARTGPTSPLTTGGAMVTTLYNTGSGTQPQEAAAFGNQVAVPQDSTVTVTATIMARDAGAALTWGVKLVGMFKNSGGTVTQVGSTAVTNLGGDPALNGVLAAALTADNTYKAAAIGVSQGSYPNNIYWRATVTSDVSVNY